MASFRRAEIVGEDGVHRSAAASAHSEPTSMEATSVEATSVEAASTEAAAMKAAAACGVCRTRHGNRHCEQ